MKVKDWIFLGLIILSFLYPWYIFRAWYDYALGIQNRVEYLEAAKKSRNAEIQELENWITRNRDWANSELQRMNKETHETKVRVFKLENPDAWYYYDDWER